MDPKETAHVVFIDSLPTLLDMLKNLIAPHAKQPDLFFDLEGINLGRSGTISICTIYVRSRDTAFLVDVEALGGSAFDTKHPNGWSLRSVFECPNIAKAVFDIRNDSDALYSLFQISVSDIEDIQLMELGARKGSKKYVASLKKCVQQECPDDVHVAWTQTKDTVTSLFDAVQGGGYEIFSKRPLEPHVLEYLKHATTERIKLSQSVAYNGHSKSQAAGPWSEAYIEEAMDQWNDDILTDDSGDGFDDWDDGDTARDCMGWEEDMIKNGEPF
ncbi:uncharacterized protein K489DRAFT_328746 [Dissoconium aciculare CBS 342.82]|uniref:3'-5' exonuclease domain-containing protein n=1 Tax=Dissoconium aciculare CBS 342.82 TaxID=1314786 RepID=A0A6J3LPL3_9PEZI|nr:uncharacterized protein K489DRAFT_328746 [Dissoconium aciculare CBS 342.82]KAF1817815.1 hypothetical protein K489DRAFT_328746 [Dissoconium aciculare CBS 342.82]